MLFTFKRDDEGRERIYVGDLHIADIRRNSDKTEYCHYTGHVPGVDFEHITSAIERAVECGFWNKMKNPMSGLWWYQSDVVTVYVAEDTP